MFNSPAVQNTSLLVGRILLALIFIIAGFGKISGFAGTQAYMDKMGVPGMLLPLVILTELGGGLLIAVGFQTRIVSLLLAGFTVLAGLLFHRAPDQVNQIMLMKNFAIAGGFLTLFVSGAGAWSIDGRRGG